MCSKYCFAHRLPRGRCASSLGTRKGVPRAADAPGYLWPCDRGALSLAAHCTERCRSAPTWKVRPEELRRRGDETQMVVIPRLSPRQQSVSDAFSRLRIRDFRRCSTPVDCMQCTSAQQVTVRDSQPQRYRVAFGFFQTRFAARACDSRFAVEVRGKKVPFPTTRAHFSDFWAQVQVQKWLGGGRKCLPPIIVFSIRM